MKNCIKISNIYMSVVSIAMQRLGIDSPYGYPSAMVETQRNKSHAAPIDVLGLRYKNIHIREMDA
jgi:hypothetical protein